jgi:glyoxylase-like metal-dependent hydrolase (beta-lactamase superfamily II)
MSPRVVPAVASVAALIVLGWITSGTPTAAELKHWDKFAEGIYRTRVAPHSYAVVDGERALLIDATAAPDTLLELGVKTVEMVLLTHHHRDAVAHAADYCTAGIAVHAPKESAEWLKPDLVARFWKESLPLRNSRTAYFVAPEGIQGITYTITDGAQFKLGPWSITAVAAPGHSRDHHAFLCQRSEPANSPRYLFSGDALAQPGRLWTPFTTDWDHWTDAGLKPAAESLRKLAKLEPAVLCPAHGDVIADKPSTALNDTAALVEEAAFMKSFERYTKERLGDPPFYKFLVPQEQIASGGDKPWARLSEHLWITGNTYVLKSTTGDGFLVLDPWGQRSADQIEKLRKNERLGDIEVVAFSHAHYDHFDGIYVLNGRDRCQIWALDRVALPLKDPLRIRAPFLDARPIAFTKELASGETASWGGYSFRFHHLPGQSWFTSGIETTIDGHRCVFTADNFFHQDQFSGSGGWMGLNRSTPAVYGASAKLVLNIAPEWVLAEHGGPYVFSAEDYRRRVRWGEAAGKAADALCLSGDHRRDWTPHRVTIEPMMQTVKPGKEFSIRVSVEGSGRPDDATTVTLNGRGVFRDVKLEFKSQAGLSSQDVKLVAAPSLGPGQNVFTATIQDMTGRDSCDPYFAISCPE